MSSAVLPSAIPDGSDHLDRGSVCCCLLPLPLPDGSHRACFSGWVVLAAPMWSQARPLCSEFSAHWFLMGSEGTAWAGCEEKPSGAVWELQPIVLGTRPWGLLGVCGSGIFFEVPGSKHSS